VRFCEGANDTGISDPLRENRVVAIPTGADVRKLIDSDAEIARAASSEPLRHANHSSAPGCSHQPAIFVPKTSNRFRSAREADRWQMARRTKRSGRLTTGR
jgi:hypothetical protein